MQMKIKLSRKPKNTRYGSLAWAATLPTVKWYWSCSTRNDCTQHVDIYNGDLLVASVQVSDIDESGPGQHRVGRYEMQVTQDNLAYSLDQADIGDSIAYGGASIGLALLRVIYLFVQGLDLTIDDQGELLITSA